MTATKRIRVCVAAAAAVGLFSPPASAQLLQELTTQVQSTLGTIACPQLLTSPKTDDGIRTWFERTAWLLASRWGDAVIWSGDPTGSGFTGTTDGQHIVWGMTGGPEETVWGNVAPIADGNGSPPDGV